MNKITTFKELDAHLCKFEKSLEKRLVAIPNGAHKFVWSIPCNSYTLSAVCEYCGVVAFYSNRSNDVYDIPETCKNNPGED